MRLGFAHQREWPTVLEMEQSFRLGDAWQMLGQAPPLQGFGARAQETRHRCQHWRAGPGLVAEHGAQPLRVHDPAVGPQAVQGLVEQSGLEPAKRAGGQQQRLGVNNPRRVALGMS